MQSESVKGAAVMRHQPETAQGTLEPITGSEDTVPLITQPDPNSKEGASCTWAAALTWPFRSMYNNGICCCLVAQLLNAFNLIAFKMLTKNGMPIFQILWLRSVSIVLISIIVIKITRQSKILGPKRIWPYLGARAFFGGIGMASYFASVPFIPVGDSVALSRLCAVFSVLFVCVLGGESLNSLMAIGAILCTAGGMIILHPPFLFGHNNHWSQHELIGYSSALSSAVFIALAFLAIAQIGTTMSDVSISLIGHLPLTVVMGISLCFSFPSPPVWIDAKNLSLLCFLLPFTFLGIILTTRGVQLCAGIQASTLQSTGIVSSYVLSFLILGEKISWFGLGGASIVGLGIWVQAYGKSKVNQDKVVEPEASENGSEYIDL